MCQMHQYCSCSRKIRMLLRDRERQVKVKGESKFKGESKASDEVRVFVGAIGARLGRGGAICVCVRWVHVVSEKHGCWWG